MPLLGTKSAARPTSFSMPHTAGLSGDRSLDGAAMGTLVVIIDRAKNLPNLRSMGKQDPYCALRLGKEAKKTETDRRGGQTPRWDQEMRFTVYESNDYNRLKVSIFNEDKRTDLIGECWIELEGIFRRGGGTNDAWHDLNVKGRYAGQIRIEMTYYDTRPREEPEVDSVEEPQDVAYEPVHAPNPRTTGPRQPQVKRRPLPGVESSSPLSTSHQRANSVPMLQAGTDSYHTPPPRDGRHYSEPDVYQTPQNYEQNSYDAPYTQRPGPPEHSISEPVYDHGYPTSTRNPNYQTTTQHASQQQEYYELDGDDYAEPDMPYTDDPHALEAVHADDYHGSYVPPPIAPLRFGKTVQHSNSPPIRPALATGPHHTHSAPILPPSQQATQDRHLASAAMQRHGYSGPAAHRQYSSPPQAADMAQPPPPPSHRNSAPLIARTTPQRPLPMQVSSGPRRALHHATSTQDYGDDSISNADPNMHYGYDDQADDEYQQEPQRRRSAEPPQAHGWQQQSPYSQSPGQVAHSSPGYANGSPSPALTRVQAMNQPSRPRPQSMDTSPSPYGRQQAIASASTNSVPLYKPRAISPNANTNARQSIPNLRKAVGSSPSPAAPLAEERPPQPAVDIFFPDSFAQFNPQMSQAPPPTSTSPFDDTRAAQPMYKDPSSAPSNARSTSGEAVADAPPTDSFGRIVRSDGRRVDPSDHLPSSTYAPEPEPKGTDKDKRANIKINVKTRFGPRGAGSSPTAPPAQNTRSTPPAPLYATPPQPAIAPRLTPQSSYSNPSPASVPNSSPLQALEKGGRNRLQKRRTSGPLAPSAPGALNSNYGYNSGVPPPVPGKIPLDTPDYPDYSYSQEQYYDQNNDFTPSPPSHHHTPPYPPQPQPRYPQQPQPQHSTPSLPAIPAQQPRRHGHGSSGYQIPPGTAPSTSLSHEISQIDLGPSPSREFARVDEEKRYGGLAGRMRRSRYGA